MTLRRKTIDNSVKNINAANNSPSENSLDHRPKTTTNPIKNEINTFHKTKKNSLKIS